VNEQTPVQILRQIVSNVRALFGIGHTDAELQEEIESHLDRLADNHRRNGATPEVAYTAARRDFGSIEHLKDQYRDQRGFAWLDGIRQDVRYAVRTLRQSPGFTVVAVLTLALGIGANTAMFSVIRGLLLAPLPYPHADRLVSLWERTPSGERNAMTTLNYLDYASSSVFEHIAASTVCCGPVVLGGGTEPVIVGALRVSASYFEVFGVRAALGRTFTAGDDQVGREHVVVISNPLWVAQFGSDPTLVGRTIRLNGEAYTVIGIMPAHGPFGRGRQVWLPLSFPAARLIRANHWLLSPTGDAVGLLQPGIGVERARAELETIATRIARSSPETNSGWGIVVDRYAAVLVGDELRRTVLLLFGAVGVVLAIGCVNLAHITLARSLAREREIAIRVALGAGHGRLIQQFMTESVLLSIGGGLLGLAFGYSMMTILETVLRNAPTNASAAMLWMPPEATIQISRSVLFFTLAVSVISGVGLGLVAGLRSARLKPGVAGDLSGRTGGQRYARLQYMLMVCELSLVFLLLAGASLLMRSVLAMRQADTGFSGTNVLTAELSIWDRRFPTDNALRSYLRRVTTAIKALPDVQDVALADSLPLQGVPSVRFFHIVGKPEVEMARRPECDFKIASPAYFRAMSLRVRAGRALLESDRFGAPYVTVINQTMARLYFPGVDPVGEHVFMQETRPDTTDEIPWTIVGVIADERLTPLTDRQPHPAAYVPIDQVPTTFASLVVRTFADPDRLRNAIRLTLLGVDHDQAIRSMRTVDQLEADARAPDRLRTWFVGIFAGVTLVLSAIGTYGVFAQAAVQRTHEIGIRAALGGQHVHLLWVILRQGVALGITGLFTGFLVALGATRLLQTFLFGVAALDPVAMSTTAVTLLAMVMLACAFPARRAAMVDPMVALRHE
jgi:putative ABC transport system permease protein